MKNEPQTTESLTNLTNWSDLDRPENFIGRTGICNKAAIAMRSEPSDAAEMVSQICYGEVFKVVGADKGCLKIQRWSNVEGAEGWGSMQGWIDNHLFPAMEVTDESVLDAPVAYTTEHTTLVTKLDGSAIRLPAGCILRGEEVKYGTEPEDFTPEKLLSYVDAYMNAPYLWGGQTSWGADCSGFIQSVMRCFGVETPRDSSQQATLGESVDPRDAPRISLAFYSEASSDKIGHVGFLYRPDDQRYVFIHAKQEVKAQELLTEEGENFLVYPEGKDKVRLKDVRVLDMFTPFKV